jgi:hypothetical protein
VDVERDARLAPGAIEVFLPSTVLRAAFLAGCAAMAIAACRPTRRPVSIVWLLGLEMFVAGTLQVVLARGMVYEAREMHAQYHLYLAFSGLALACAAMVVAAGIALSSIEVGPTRSRLLRASEHALVAGSLAIYVLFQHLRVERLWPVMTAYPLADACAPRPLPPERTRASVICAREDLRRDLARYVAAAVAESERDRRRKDLPDFALVDSPRFDELALWPRSVDSDPRYIAQYRRMSKAGYLLRVLGILPWTAPGLPLRFVPIEKLDRPAIAALYDDGATGAFLRKYWPQFEPARTE